MRINYIFDFGSSKEDLYLIKDSLFAVFDGFGSLKKFTDRRGRSGGLIAAEIAQNTFSRDGGGSLKELAMEANKKIKEKMRDLKVDARNTNNLWGTTFAAVRVRDGFFEWAQITDSLILLIFKDNSYKLPVEDFDHGKELLMLWKRLAAQKKENIRELVAKQHAKLRAKANKTYGALNGKKAAENFLKFGECSLRDIKHILLFTDGLMLPKEDPMAGDDWRLFSDLFLRGGLENVKNYVRNLQKSDPKCWKYPRFKQYDDITAISLTF